MGKELTGLEDPCKVPSQAYGQLRTSEHVHAISTSYVESSLLEYNTLECPFERNGITYRVNTNVFAHSVPDLGYAVIIRKLIRGSSAELTLEHIFR